jgi:hypothetical protein
MISLLNMEIRDAKKIHAMAKKDKSRETITLHWHAHKIKWRLNVLMYQICTIDLKPQGTAW